jgi:hypothetical protein
MPAKERRPGVFSVSIPVRGSLRKPMSSRKVSNGRPPKVAATRERWLPPRRSSGAPVRSMLKEKKSAASHSAASISVSRSSVSAACQSRSTSFVARARSASRRSSANPPFNSQQSGATVPRRASSRSKATRLRSRARRAPYSPARVFSRCSSAWRKAPPSLYLTRRLQREQVR